MRKVLFLSLCLTYSFLLRGQTQNYSQSYDWDPNPTLTATDSTQHAGPVYKITDNTIVEIATDENGKSVFLVSAHYRAKVLTEAGIEYINKVEVSLNGVEEIVRLRARTIKPNGEVSVLSTSSIRHVENYNETNVDYKVFVFEGIEIGSEVEYIYTFKKSPFVYGSVLLQWNVDAREELFTLVYPGYLDFRIKKYGENIQTSTDTLMRGEKKFIKHLFTHSNVKGLGKEAYSHWRPHLARVDYVLDKNKSTGNYSMNSYKLLAQTYYDRFYPETSDPNPKAVALLKKISKSTDRLRLAKDIETYTKLNFKFENAKEDKDLKRIFTGFSGSMLDRTIALIELYRAAGYKVELAFTISNEFRKFDPDFESPANCVRMLIYLPEVKYFVSAEHLTLKSGYYETNTFGQNGLFVKQTCIGEFCSGIGYIGYIPENRADDSVHDMDLDISLSSDLSSANINFVYSMSGYHAAELQPIYELIDADNQKILQKELVQGFAGNYLTADIQVENGTRKDAFDKPFILRGQVSTSSMVESAGNKILFKVGELIGEQYELYNEDGVRNLPIENDYNRVYTRHIKFKVPEGYQIMNLNELTDNQITCKLDDKIAAGIEFDYEFSNGILIIKINEYYNVLNLPKESFEDYRKVINGAADFNKKVIVLMPN